MNNLWVAITEYVTNNPVLSLLMPSSKSQQFKVISWDENLLIIQFEVSKTTLILERSRFQSALNILNEKSGQWVRIGSSRINTDIDTLEGRIKKDYNGKMNGLSTAPWIAAILVGAFDNIVFNGQKKGQALIIV